MRMSTISINIEFENADIAKEDKGIQSVHIVSHKIICLDSLLLPKVNPWQSNYKRAYHVDWILGDFCQVMLQFIAIFFA